MVNTRVFILFLGLVSAWCMIILRAAQLQILPNSRLADLERRQYRTLIELPARRGLILDRQGKELAVTVPSYSLYADPREIENAKAFSRQVSKRLGFSYNSLYDKVKNDEHRFVWIKRHLKKEYVEQFRAMHLKGLGVVEESLRVYPNENLLAQVLGFVGEEGKGLEGLELKFDNVLKGESRKIKIERDARGRPLLVDGRIFTDTPAGFDMHLTIDAELQFKLERELAETLAFHQADNAMGIVLDARTSEILAIASTPSFDPNRASDFSSDNWRDRVVTDAFEPGSTVKTLLIAGALREGTTQPNKKYFCENGLMKVDDRVIHEADHKFGWLTTSEILMKSSNIGAAKIAFELGADRTRKILSDFGLGDHLGADLPGESKGVLQPVPWRQHLLANISFGHGVTATPLQVAAAYAAIANGGILRTPTIVKEFVNEETGERKAVGAVNHDIRRVLTPEQAATMRLMLNAVTSDQGTGFAARVVGFPVAGKTGTAQKMIVGKGYGKNQYISSFAGFLPANDPRYVIYVAVDNPRNQVYGAEAGAPLFSKVASFAVRRAGLAPVLISEKSVMKKSVSAGEAQAREESIHKIREMAKVLSDEEQNLTPDFTGLTLRDVLNRVRGTPIRVQFHGRGVVSMSEPVAGTQLPGDKRVNIYLNPKLSGQGRRPLPPWQ